MPCAYRTERRIVAPDAAVLEGRLGVVTLARGALGGEFLDPLLRAREPLPARSPSERLALLEQPHGLLEPDVARLEPRDDLVEPRERLLERRRVRLLRSCVRLLDCHMSRVRRASRARVRAPARSPPHRDDRPAALPDRERSRSRVRRCATVRAPPAARRSRRSAGPPPDGGRRGAHQTIAARPAATAPPHRRRAAPPARAGTPRPRPAQSRPMFGRPQPGHQRQACGVATAAAFDSRIRIRPRTRPRAASASWASSTRLVGDDGLGRRRRGRYPPVSHEVADGDVLLVAHRTHDGRPRRGDRTAELARR